MTEVDFLTQNWRRILVLSLFTAMAGVLVWRAVDLQVVNNAALRNQGEARHVRVVDIPAHRGIIADRHGEPLAISTPVDSVWINPRRARATTEQLRALAHLLEVSPLQLARRVAERLDREFVFLKRHVSPAVARQVLALNIPGVNTVREYRRYYPAAEAAGHLVGFTDIDDRGLEGLERAYDHWLRGTPGKQRVLQDRFHRVIENIEQVSAPRPGKALYLSIDRRIQYLAYRSLKRAVRRHGARGGTIVVMDVHTGEVLALVNQPGFNPNSRAQRHSRWYRNRGVVDVFEPGSAIKPFIVAAALESGRFRVDDTIDTAPGYFFVGRKKIQDKHNLGVIDLKTLLQRSSNVGASKLALSLERQQIWQMLVQLGFGQTTGSGFPGERSGRLANYTEWRKIDQAALAYGYGVSVTALQLARAYTAIANGGRLVPVSLLRVSQVPGGHPVMSPKTARAVTSMLEAVVSVQGTGLRAAVPGYRIAGKTGTARKVTKSGYSHKDYVSLFAGFAPASRPRLAVVVVIDAPANGDYYGGKVAAPVFAEVMGGALRLMDVAPDDFTRAGIKVVELPAGRRMHARWRSAGALDSL